jgi:polar amino acid transport system substrate-binding protein
MKKLGIALCCALALTGFVYAGGGAEKKAAAPADASLQKVMDKGKFVLGLDDSFPPMGFRDAKNNIVGYDIDLAREVCKRMGVELVPQPSDWNAKEQELSTGEIDCIWNGFTIRPGSALLYSPAYLDNAQMVVVKKNSPVKTLADLKGKVVGTQAGSTSIDAIDHNPAFKASLKKVVEYKDFLTALMDLDTGGIDAVVIDLVVGNYSIKQSGKDFRMLDQNLGKEQFGIGFRPGDTALEQKVWDTLLAMAKDGTVAKITTQWFGSDISVIGK